MSRRHLPPYERSDRSHGGHGSMNKPWLDEQASEEKKLSHGWMNKQVKNRQGKAVVPAF